MAMFGQIDIEPTMRDLINAIVRDVAELPDRTSPLDQPDMMLVSADELRDILNTYLD